MHMTIKISLATSIASAALLPAMAFAQTVNSDATTTLPRNTQFLSTFIQTIADDTGVHSSFDVRQFRSHPCYTIVGEELDYCLELLGLPSDFQTLIKGNQMAKMFVEFALESRCQTFIGDEQTRCIRENETALNQVLAQMERSNLTTNTNTTDDDTVGSEEEEDAMSIRDQRATRSARVWSLCKSQGDMQAACFQNYGRFIRDLMLPLSSLEHILNRSGDDEDADPNDNDDDTTQSRSHTDSNVMSEEDEDTSPMNNRDDTWYMKS